MSYRRDHHASRSALFDKFDGVEEGFFVQTLMKLMSLTMTELRIVYKTVFFLKRLTGDIHEEVESHNRLLDHMGNNMDASRGIMSGTMDRFKMVFEKKSNRITCALAACFVVSFLIIYYLIRVFRYFIHG